MFNISLHGYYTFNSVIVYIYYFIQLSILAMLTKMLNIKCEIIITKSSSRRGVFEQDGLFHAEQRQAVLHPALQAALHHTGKLWRGLRRRSTQEQMGDDEFQQFHEPIADRGLKRRSLIFQVSRLTLPSPLVHRCWILVGFTGGSRRGRLKKNHPLSSSLSEIRGMDINRIENLYYVFLSLWHSFRKR